MWKLQVGFTFIEGYKGKGIQSDAKRSRATSQAMITNDKKGKSIMAVYKILEVVGTSPTSWEDATQTAVATAAKSLEDLRIAEVVRMDVTIAYGKIMAYRVRLNLSFKYKDKE
jgi:dodecin